LRIASKQPSPTRHLITTLNRIYKRGFPNCHTGGGGCRPIRFVRTALIPMMCSACASENEHELRGAQVNTNAAPLPPGLDRAIMRLVRAMARDAAKRDHERERYEASSNIRPVLHGPAE